MFRKVEQNSATDDVITQIVTAIKSEELAAGARLPSERQLAELFQVSRATIREALKHLAAVGYIETRRGLGNFVHSSEATIDEGDMSPEMVMETRFAVEPYLVQLCTRRATDNEIAKIEEILALSERHPENFISCDNDFHFAIAASAHSTMLEKTAEGIYRGRKGIRWGGAQANAITPERLLIYFQQHRDILAAIRNRDPGQAHRAIRTHLLTASQVMLGTWPPLPVTWESVDSNVGGEPLISFEGILGTGSHLKPDEQ